MNLAIFPKINRVIRQKDEFYDKSADTARTLYRLIPII